MNTPWIKSRSKSKPAAPLLATIMSFSIALATSFGCNSLDGDSSLKEAAANGRFFIKSINSGLCLDVPEGKQVKGAELTQYECKGNDAQTFELRENKDGSYRILSANGQLSLDITGISKESGAKLQLWDSLSGDNQKFILEKEGADQYYIRAKHSNQVLDVADHSKANSAAVLQWPKNSTANQRWNLVRINQDARNKSIVLTANNHVYFKGGDSQREKKFKVTFPENTNGYSKVMLRFKLSCPDGHCDAWDRTGSFGIYSTAHNKKYLELLRFMTPYGIGGEWALDVTDFLPLFKGEQEFRLFIDTWVGPGNSAGNGWLVDLTLDYTAGYNAENTVLIVPILSMDDIAYGIPNRSTKRSAPIVPLLGYKSAKVVSTITGHGQGNAQNCAEFCAKNHSITVGKKTFSKVIWRDDCETTTSQEQRGNAKSPRAGWCPGDIVKPWSVDVTTAIDSGDAVVSYDVEAYENTCRPDAAECKGCVFGTPCAYDGGLHTDPKYYVTSYVIYKN